MKQDCTSKVKLSRLVVRDQVGRSVSVLLPVRQDKGVLFTGSYPICPSHSMSHIYFLVIHRILNLGQCVAQYLIMTIGGQ